MKNPLSFSLFILFLMSPLLANTQQRQAQAGPLKIFDLATSPGRALVSVEQVTNVAFKEYLEGLMEAVSILRKSGLKVSGSATRIPVHLPNHIANLPSTNTAKHISFTCSGESPWVDFFYNSYTRELHAYFTWNERLLISDFFGINHPNSEKKLTPIRESLYLAMSVAYKKNSPNAEVSNLIIPPDIQALFSNSPRSTLLPFSATVGMFLEDILANTTISYLQKSIDLIDICTYGASGDFHFDTNGEVKKM
jgi:hypothetical protein